MAAPQVTPKATLPTKKAIPEVTDYCATSPSLTPLVRNFQIGQHNSILSDHSILVTELNLQHTPHQTRQSHSSLLRFDWSPEAQDRLKISLQEPHFQLQLRLLEARLTGPNADIDNIVSDFPTSSFKKPNRLSASERRDPPQKNPKNQAANGMTNLSDPSKRKYPPSTTNSARTHPPTSANR